MTDLLLAALRVRYTDAEGYAVLSEVRDRTGYAGGGSRRYADFLAMGTWQNRGLELSGFEVKEHRSDWLRELKDPAKADSIFKFCDRWWLVSSPDVAKLEEIPTPWGWMEWAPKREGLRVRKQAPVLTPTELTRPFLASLLRSLARQEGAQAAIAKAAEEARSQGFREGQKVGAELQRSALEKALSVAITAEQRRLLDCAEQFQRDSGYSLTHSYRLGERAKKAFALLDAVDEREARCELLRVARTLRTAARALRTVAQVDAPEAAGGRGDFEE